MSVGCVPKVVDLLSCRRQSFRQVWYKSAVDCTRNANECPKMPFALFRNSEENEQELISRLDSRTLPLQPCHRCTSSVLSTCPRNDVLASCLVTKHTPDDMIVTHPILYDLSIGPIFNDLERLDFKVTPRRCI